MEDNTLTAEQQIESLKCSVIDMHGEVHDILYPEDVIKAIEEYHSLKSKELQKEKELESIEARHWMEQAKDMQATINQQKDQIEKLQKFKDYVHKRLDDMGILIDPDSPHKEKGCRIGGRLDIVQQQKDQIKLLVERKDQLEEWLTDYRDDLRKTNVFHKNQALINAINEILQIKE
jgi:hypothetical protein